MTELIQLREFDPSTMQQNSSYMIIGMRNTGKTTTIKDILSYRKDVPYGVVLTATDKNEYSGLVPDEQIHETYSADIIKDVLKRQSHGTDKSQLLMHPMDASNLDFRYESGDDKSAPHCNIDGRAFLVLDNFMYDTSWTKDTLLHGLIMHTQSYQVSVLISMLYAMGIPPAIRTDKSQFIVHPEGVRYLDFRYRSGVYDKSEPHGTP